MHKYQKGCDFGVSTSSFVVHILNILSVSAVICGVLYWILFTPSSPLHCRHTLAPYAFENTLRVNPVFENDDGVLTQVSTLPCPSSSASSQSQQSEQEHFASIENIHLSIEVHCAAQHK